MENWRKRWEQLTEDVAIEGYLPNGEMASDSDIEDFISEELDKAREEGRREGSEITSRYISDFVKSESGKSGRKEILEYIDKLSKLKQ